MLIDYVGKVVKKTGDTILGLANSGVVKGASKLTAATAKAGVEAGAGILNKGIKTVKNTIPKLKEFDIEKMSAGVGKATNKTLVGLDGDYIKRGSIGKTDYLTTNKTFGLVDAVTDRARLYADGTASILKGKQFEIKSMTENNIKNEWLSNKVSKMGRINTGLVETGGDNFMPFGLKATGLGSALAVGVSGASGTFGAAKQWNQTRQGNSADPTLTSMAPRPPAYSNNGGATGDLVFAMNNLRHGGML